MDVLNLMCACVAPVGGAGDLNHVGRQRRMKPVVNDLVRVTSDITLDDLRTGRIRPVDLYAAQVRHWIIEPGSKLASLYPDETDHGMALLAIELMFFEPHGRLLPNEPRTNGSKMLFCRGFNRFREHLRASGTIGEDTDGLATECLYKWARCGLFHSSVLADDLLVDATRYAGRCLAQNPVLGGWLVDPWLLLDGLEDYLDAYMEDLKSDPESELRRAFEAEFAALVRAPLERIANGRPSNHPAGDGRRLRRRRSAG